MPTTMSRAAALAALQGACDSGRLDRTRVVSALDALDAVPPDDDATGAVLRLGEMMLAAAFGGRPQAPVLERCVRLLARAPERRALPFYRAATTCELPIPYGDAASALRGLALAALRPLEPREARFVAVRLLSGVQSPSGEPARTALAVLGEAGDDVAMVLACRTLLSDDIPLKIAALQALSTDVPATAFWEVATALVSDRFADAVLAITDLIVDGRRADLLPGLAAALVEVSDPDLMRAVLLSLLGGRVEGVETVFAAVVEGAPICALPGIEDALMSARLATRDEMLHRLSERARRSTATG